MQVGNLVKITPKSKWAEEMTHEYGHIGQVGKIGEENVMIVNRGCTNIEPQFIGFVWGYWLHNSESTLEVL